jgi:hypothetical protein
MMSRGRILGRKTDKSLKSFPPCYSQSPLQLCLRFIFLQTHETSYSFYSSFTLHCIGKKRKPYPLTYGLRNPYRNSSLRALKIMPRKLNEIVYSWIPLYYRCWKSSINMEPCTVEFKQQRLLRGRGRVPNISHLAIFVLRYAYCECALLSLWLKDSVIWPVDPGQLYSEGMSQGVSEGRSE